MSFAVYSHVPPELGPVEIDERTIQAFWHGFPSPHVRWHFHNEYELHLILASSGKVFVGDHVSQFEPGQLIMTGPCLPHNWVSQVSQDASIEMRDCVVQFRGDLIQSMATHAPELKALLPLLDRASHGIEFYGSIRADAAPWFENMINSKGVLRLGLLFDFLERLSRERSYQTLSSVNTVATKGKMQMEKLERAINYATQFHANEIRLESIASLVGMNKNSFSHFFTKSTGSSFTHFLNTVRVSHACELLSITDKPITEICHTVGFNNVANFNRRFRELKGLTPSMYRKETKLGHRESARIEMV